MQRLLVTILAIHGVVASAQQVGESRSQNPTDNATFHAGVHLVVETVVVNDKNGNPVQGLTSKDFNVVEDGVPQTIRTLEYQDLPITRLPLMNGTPNNVRIYRNLDRAQIVFGSVGKTLYKDRRLLALYFDMSAMLPADQVRALSAADKFIRAQMSSGDLLAILRYSGGSVDVLQDFTEDRNRLLSIIQTMSVGEGQGFGESTSDASAPDMGAAFGQDDSEFNIFNTDRQLSALQTAANMLSGLSEKKSLVYFAGGLRLNGLSNQAQLRATINSAVRAGVSIWPIDARGLVAMPPLGDATTGSPGNGGMYSGAAASTVSLDFQQSQDTLFALAADTGGKAFLDANDLDRGIVNAERSVSSYYVIAYYTTNDKEDGKFRRIKISLNNNVYANLNYRAGYFAAKQFGKFTPAEKERQLEDALMLPDPITELTIAMEIDYFQLNRAEYFVPIVVRIPGHELALAKRGGAEQTVIDFIGEIKDAYGTTMTNVRDKVRAKLTGATAAELSKRPIVYDTGFTLLPGRYAIKFLARDDETGRIGTYQATFVVPNLNSEEMRLPISSVILSNQRVPLKEAIYSAAKDDVETSNPLVHDGEKLLPSVTRVFRTGHSLYVYLQAYEQEVDGFRPLVAFVSFYSAHEKVFESRPIEVKRGGSGHLTTIPIEFEFSLDRLVAGKYDCQVSVLDPTAKKATFWRAPIVLVR